MEEHAAAAIRVQDGLFLSSLDMLFGCALNYLGNKWQLCASRVEIGMFAVG